jgi:nitroimidazol reductase NimA-like FMN-containing flavoprotein (pyridoxamine 5'-phosphate oxidase superfamily)
MGCPWGGSVTNPEPESVAAALDRRGKLHRANREMTDEDSQQFLKEQRVVHIGTKDARGWPYVVPLVYVYEGGDLFYFHTGGHRGHFENNVLHDPLICVEVSSIGALHKGEPYACNSSLEYSSVIAFGMVRLIEDTKMKEWFFDRLLAKYGEPGWTFEPGYPLLDRITLYELEMEVMTGKKSSALGH